MPLRILSTKQLHVILWGCCCLLLTSGGPAKGEASSHDPYRTLETKHTIIHYRSLEDLEDFDDEIDYSDEGLFGSLFSSSDDDIKGKVKKKTDVLFRRVQKILDMRKKMKKVNIKIYRDREELKRAYTKIYSVNRRPVRKRRIPRAWYRFKDNTIYINLDDLHEGMLAHEMAHAIIDNYLVIKPPRATAEILARYVDTHLFD